MKELSMHVYDLMENSTAANSTEVKLTIRDSIRDNDFHFTIEDNGKGMSPEFLAKVTDPYTTSVFAGLLVGFVADGLFATCEGVFEGLDDDFFVELVEAALGCLCEAYAHYPAEGVALVVEDGFFGFGAT